MLAETGLAPVQSAFDLVMVYENIHNFTDWNTFPLRFLISLLLCGCPISVISVILDEVYEISEVANPLP